MEKEKKRFNVEEHTTLDNKIIDVFPISHRYIHELETELKKQKEIIDKMKTTIKNDMDGFTTINEHGESQEILDLLEIYLEILEDKEV